MRLVSIGVDIATGDDSEDDIKIHISSAACKLQEDVSRIYETPATAMPVSAR
jgi:hypothetical protein